MRVSIVPVILSALMVAGCMGSGTAPTMTPPTATRATSHGAPLVLSGGISSQINQQRQAAGLAPVRRSGQLDRVAMAHARDQVAGGFFGHTGSNGSTVYQRMRVAGYDACLSAENIAMGQQSEEAVMADWMASPGHRANILHARATEYGVARVGAHWVMVLARPC